MKTMERKIKYIFLPLILLSVLAMRLYTVKANLPYTFWHDENNYIEAALRFGTGDFRMVSYSHGGVFQLLLFAEYAVYYLAMKLSGNIATARDFLIMYLKDPSVFFILARVTAALCGTGIVWLSFLIARRVFNIRAAVMAALFTGFSFIMVQMSSFAFADVPAVFLLLLTFLFLLMSLDNPRSSAFYYCACVLAGLAAAAKYSAIFGMVPVYMTAFFRWKACTGKHSLRLLIRDLFLGSIVSAAVFFVSIPSLIFNFGTLYKDTFVRLGGEYILMDSNKNAWLYYFTNHLRNGLGIPLEAASLGGVLYAFYKHSREQLILVSFPVSLYLLLMNSTGFAYHSLPAMPLILILGSGLIDFVVSGLKLRRPFLISMTICIAVVAPTFFDSAKFVFIINRPDTRILAKTWIEKTVEPGSSILEEGYAGKTAAHCPPLAGDRATLQRDMDDVVALGGSGSLMKTALANFDTIYGTSVLYNIFKTDIMREEEILALKPSYIVLTGDNDKPALGEMSYYIKEGDFEKRAMLKEALVKEYTLLKKFCPSDEFSAFFPHLASGDYAVIRRITPDKLYGYVKGPVIEIYKKGE